MRVRAIGDDLSVLVGQHLWCEFFDLFRWNIQRSGEVCFAVPFGRERLDDVDRFFSL
jgi:hypothetical protein